ncbi:HEAT repeat domain-containing protein (plasmid) [Priestia megaterium NCT-2]|uniref:HEAT repeat domain-containing protein n=1 Tax=Priestia megaterium TaxID=1404 RepID=UPI00034DC3E2|nr:HEAT repeat domain-containing protein [Priestia megaterium]AYE53559.1 HEAT repeat domain-containing protein [Priestia megaterium NCT-2]
MTTISELLNEKIKNQLGVEKGTTFQPYEEKKSSSALDIDAVKLKTALNTQAEEIRIASEEVIVEDLFADDEPETESGHQSKLLYNHPDVGGIEVIVDIEHLVPDMEGDVYRSYIQLIEQMANETNNKQSLNAFTTIKERAQGNEINVLYVLFRKARLFDFTHDYTRDLLVNSVANLCAYNLKGRALLKGILTQSQVEEHLELAIRSAGQIRAKEVLPDIYQHAKKGNNDLFIVCLEAIVNIGDTKAAIDFLPIIETIPDSNNDLIGQAIRLSRKFNGFDDTLIEPLYEALIQCNKRYLRPIYSEGIKSFGARAIPSLANFIRKMDDAYHVRQAAKNIGGIRSPLSSETLRKLFYELPHRQVEILDGLAHTRDRDNLPLLLECLKNTTNNAVKRMCIKSISSLADDSYIPSLKPYLKDPVAYLEAIYALMRLGDAEAEELFFDKLLNGTPEEQDRLENFTSLLPQRGLLKMAKKAASLPDMDAIILLSALYKPNVLPKEIGPLLKGLLTRQPKPAAPVRIAIYRIIGKFVGSDKELLGIDTLRSALKIEEPNVKRELDSIISSLKVSTNKGGIGTVK